MLNSYLQQTQRLLADKGNAKFALSDLTEYINRARREVAMRTQSVRILPPISGSIQSVTVTSGGSGYSAPTVVITAPDFPSGQAPNPGGQQATATATVGGGAITAITMGVSGSGYFQPTVTLSGAGSGAVLTPVLSGINQTVANQEVYAFSAVPISEFSGVSSILAVLSVSIIYASQRYQLQYMSFTEYQAYVRLYPNQYYYVPAVFTQYGQGASGSLYMYPIPSQSFQMEWDCIGLPADLANDSSAEAIPAPWTDVVPYFAAHLALLPMDQNAAFAMLKLYDDMTHRYSAYTRPGIPRSMYSRY